MRQGHPMEDHGGPSGARRVVLGVERLTQRQEEVWTGRTGMSAGEGWCVSV